MDLKETFTPIYSRWLDAVNNFDARWFEAHLADTFTCTAVPFPGVTMDKQQFIEVEEKLGAVKAQLVDVVAHLMGATVFSYMFVRLEGAGFTVDPGEGMPSAAQLNAVYQGNTVAYAASWRKSGAAWQCFDMRLLGPVG